MCIYVCTAYCYKIVYLSMIMTLVALAEKERYIILWKQLSFHCSWFNRKFLQAEINFYVQL